MKCEFEEKTYEQYHNLELIGKDKILFPPGQIQENKFGIDSALFSENERFWRIWWYYNWWIFPPIPRGVYLSDLLEDEFWEDLKDMIDAKDFPKFKFNIFIQYKRPEYIKSPRGKEYSSWTKPYFRYDLLQHQQDILLQLEKNVNRNAIVVYAAPAFYKMYDLLNYYTNGKLIENSNYVKPSKLNRHTRWTYINGGTNGLAFSESERIEGVSLLEEIRQIREQTIDYESNSKFIEKTSDIIIKSIRDVKYLWKIFKKMMVLLPGAVNLSYK